MTPGAVPQPAWGRRSGFAGLVAVVALAIGSPAWAAGGAVSATTTTVPSPAVTLPGSGPATPGQTSPGVTGTPVVPANLDPSLTDGHPAQTLLAQATTLTSVGVQAAQIQQQLDGVDKRIEELAVQANQAHLAAARAVGAQAVARHQAETAQARYTGLQGTLKAAALRMYLFEPSTPMPTGVKLGDSQAMANAAVYEDSLLSPDGVLAARSADEKLRDQDLVRASHEAGVAATDAAAADRATVAEKGQQQRLQSTLSSLDATTAQAVAADQAALTQQAAANLATPASLQFTPSTPVPPQPTTTNVALAWAFAQLGKPYLWGGTGPDSFDCSGLTQFAWAAAGIAIPRVAADQDSWTIPVPLSELLPGDLVFFGTSDIHHVGMYIGDGLMINAPHTGAFVSITSIWWSDLAGFGRVHSPTTPVPPHGLPTVVAPAAPAVVAGLVPVPSQATPPPGWQPAPGETAPMPGYTGPDSSTTTSTTTTSTTTTSTTTAPDTPPSPTTPDTTPTDTTPTDTTPSNTTATSDGSGPGPTTSAPTTSTPGPDGPGGPSATTTVASTGGTAGGGSTTTSG